MAAFLEYAAMLITDPIAAHICDLFFENKQIIQNLDAADEILSELSGIFQMCVQNGKVLGE